MPATLLAEEERDYGCLKCLVTWRGQPVCWSCGDSLFVVGSAVVRQKMEGNR